MTFPLETCVKDCLLETMATDPVGLTLISILLHECMLPFSLMMPTFKVMQLGVQKRVPHKY